MNDNIFTIGDTIESDSGKHIITSFQIQENKIRVNYKGVLDNQIYWNYLNNIKKAKTPILVTDDNIEMYSKDIIWIVTNNDFVLLNTLKAEEITTIKLPIQGYKIFSTKEAAEEYVIINKPCLSLMDLRKAGYVTASVTLKQLVKSKLK